MRSLWITIGLGLVAAVGLLAANRSGTPPIRGPDGRWLPGSVASLERVRLGGVDQYILLRGHDLSSPILLFVHGGPGMPMMYLGHTFQRDLERHFVVVHWDQRGAGKSYDPDLPGSELSVERLLSDAEELVGLLRRRFGAERIFLVGHSFGSHLGMIFARRHPELLHAYVGVGQVVDDERAARLQDEFIRKEARARGALEAVRELQEGGAAAREKWLFEFGGELHEHTSWLPLLWAGLRAPEYSLMDAVNVGRGSGFSSRHMKYDALSGPLVERITSVEVPVYFFAGRHDFTTPSELAERYLELIEAPRKRLVWFEDSAHFPFFEEPGRFTEEILMVRDEVLAALPAVRASAGEGEADRVSREGVPHPDREIPMGRDEVLAAVRPRVLESAGGGADREPGETVPHPGRDDGSAPDDILNPRDSHR